MSIITCVECGKEVSSEDKTCPHCGKKLKTDLFDKVKEQALSLGESAKIQEMIESAISSIKSDNESGGMKKLVKNKYVIGSVAIIFSIVILIVIMITPGRNDSNAKAYASNKSGNEQLCLGDVCLGDSIEKLKNHTWISSNSMVIDNIAKFPSASGSGGPIGSFDRAKTDIATINKYKSSQKLMDDTLKYEIEFCSKYVLGINDNDKLSLNTYFYANLFDAVVLNIFDKVTACKSIRLNGFKMTDDGNFDRVTIAPLPSTGKFEVDSVCRQFPKMDNQQNEAFFSSIKTKYPSTMSRNEAEVAIRGTKENKWDLSKPIRFWDERTCAYCITKVLLYPGDQRGTFITKLATELRSAGGVRLSHGFNNDDDPLMQNQPCKSSLSQTPKMNID